MNRTIFYSWQSDLPNRTNRGFIESCLKKTVSNLSNLSPFSIELNIDRDTKSVIGTPDILASIFSKIARSKIFVADITIINAGSSHRKCPNPNVLIELGYAARVLGWERVFCVYNTDYGTIEDLPFDLRQRRPIMYSFENRTKASVREEIADIFTNSIRQLHRNGLLFDKVDDYVKEKVDTEILTMAGHLGKMLFDYQGKSVPELTQLLLNLTDTQIEKAIQASKKIGFQIYKHFGVHEQNLRTIADAAISSVHQNKEMAIPVIELISWIGRFDALNTPRNPNQWFVESDSSNNDYKALPPISFQPNAKMPDRYVLTKKIDQERGIVVDFGDFPDKVRAGKLLTWHVFNQITVTTFVSVIREFIDATNHWLDLTNGEFILDTYHHFEIKSLPIKKLPGGDSM